jgi:pimeloyl-ACP methyl ester carboxylesterase
MHWHRSSEGPVPPSRVVDSNCSRQEEGVSGTTMTITQHAANSPDTNIAQLNPMRAARQHASNADNTRTFPIPVADSMNPSEEELPPFPVPEVSSIQLDHKPGAKLDYTYYSASAPKNHSNPFSQTLIVYLNGLMLPRSSWDASIHSFLEKRIVGRLPYPGLLSYDRYGQGESDHDPTDKRPPPCHGHDAMSAVQDLKQLILGIWRDHLDSAKPTHFPSLIFVCNSIGCALARLFIQQHPGTVSGLLFLDSIMANSDNMSIWPDPDASDFNEHTLPDGVTADEVRETRRKYKAMFHPDVPNMEGLSRSNLAQLLPDSNAPRLEGYLGKGPYLTIVGHDWETFAEQSCMSFPFTCHSSPLTCHTWSQFPTCEIITHLHGLTVCSLVTGSLHIPKILTMTYANPAWRRYNEGLTYLTDDGRSIGPIVAVGCGHFIQRDGPGFVSDELVSLLDRVVNRVEQVKERGGAS